MTPKEKANQLYRAFQLTLPDAVEISHNTIKQCAISACNEVLNCIYQDTIEWQGAVVDEVGAHDYWSSVKVEISKL